MVASDWCSLTNIERQLRSDMMSVIILDIRQQQLGASQTT